MSAQERDITTIEYWGQDFARLDKVVVRYNDKTSDTLTDALAIEAIKQQVREQRIRVAEHGSRIKRDSGGW